MPLLKTSLSVHGGYIVLLLLIIVTSYGLLLALVGMPALWANWQEVLWLGRQHLRLVSGSMLLALLVGLPLAVLLSRPRWRPLAGVVMQLVNIGNTLPVLALLALVMMLVGIGDTPAIITLFLTSLLPVVGNSYFGLRSVPAPLLEAARGMGMSGGLCWWKVELPYAWPLILAGIRTAMTINIATAPLAFLIGASGYGELIFPGIYLNDASLLVLGAGATAFTALVLDVLLAWSGGLVWRTV